MSTNAFSSLANFRLPTSCRLVENSCCPDKDLLVLFSRLGGTDRMSLWNINQGSKVWEVGVGQEGVYSQAVCIAWSPDGQSIAVVAEPQNVALHSLQDGRIISTLVIPPPISGSDTFHFTGAWWFRDEGKQQSSSSIPDIFRRNGLITGSALSILRLLPLLDSLQEESDKLTATDLFAFQGSHTRLARKSALPETIARWPTLPADLLAASISGATAKTPPDTAGLDESDTTNVNSVLMVADDSGHLLCYLDGSFPLGIISSGSKANIVSVAKHPSKPLFSGHPRSLEGNISRTSLNLVFVDIPLLSQRKARDFAELSSVARELMWYSIRVVKEMREAWYGSESMTGARDLGPRWVKSLEEKQKEQFGQGDPTPILDMTCLLTTGRATESLADFLGSGEQMSERGIQKWETTVSDALVKLRDYSEKRIAPALQRLILVLDELHGWSKLYSLHILFCCIIINSLRRPQFSVFELQADEINECINSAGRGIVITSWLAAIVRRELLRFREFMTWLRYEVNNLNAPNEAQLARHDLLEVNHYLMDGLQSSRIDNWFIGPTPQFRADDLGIPSYGNTTLKQIIRHARNHARNYSEMSQQESDPQNDLEKLDRNIDALIDELGHRCERIFHEASSAASRSAIVSFADGLDTDEIQGHLAEQSWAPLFRERTNVDESGGLVQHIAAFMPSSEDSAIFLAQLHYECDSSLTPSRIGIVPLECYVVNEDSEQIPFDVLELEFFDAESIVIVGRTHEEQRRPFVAMLDYSNITYQSDEYVRVPTREDLMQNAWALWKKGQLSPTGIPINRRRVLAGCKTGGVSLAVNGRVGRRVACVLDSGGTTLESFDLEGDGEETEIADESRAG
ncbi:hypothetical protein CVT26_002094 [Gymnopilus dilepis]|uniref:Anaphase-promoting complex subunit 4 n=1 Tax=Gymnopilus dilepis TaxID=231916 RepID=A0A409VEV6_9AGAR|nr:hypothetical protein CVT26_002094 [Gymnopilus dilepis]